MFTGKQWRAIASLAHKCETRKALTMISVKDEEVAVTNTVVALRIKTPYFVCEQEILMPAKLTKSMKATASYSIDASNADEKGVLLHEVEKGFHTGLTQVVPEVENIYFPNIRKLIEDTIKSEVASEGFRATCKNLTLAFKALDALGAEHVYVKQYEPNRPIHITGTIDEDMPFHMLVMAHVERTST